MAPTNLKIYVAGPIGNTTDYPERFAEGCKDVFCLGHTPVNPLQINPSVANTPETWRQCMIIDIRALLECDGIYMLRGWENSRGASLERHIAASLGMVVMYQDEQKS